MLPIVSRRAAFDSEIQPIGRAFYERSADVVAEELVGRILVRRWRRRVLRARIVETEAYVGCHDLACHAAKGRTARTDVMFGPGGHAYVYLIYGMYDMLNIVAGREGDAQAVLIRAAEPLDGWDANLSGPGKLAKLMHITRRYNGIDMTTNSSLCVIDAPRGATPPRIERTPRIGIDYAKDWRDALLRYVDADSPAVSKRR